MSVLRGFQVHTVTHDDGLEFALHRFVNDLLGAEVPIPNSLREMMPRSGIGRESA